MKSIFIFGNNDILINYYKYFTALNYKVIISCDIKKANKCDMLCLAGGGDVNPYLYGQRNICSTNLDTFRDLAELELTYLFISKNKPIIAICRGLQLLNVYFGGSILQNINNMIEFIYKRLGESISKDTIEIILELDLLLDVIRYIIYFIMLHIRIIGYF